MQIDRDGIRLSEQRLYSGIWLDEFERQLFLRDKNSIDAGDFDHETWLDIEHIAFDVYRLAGAGPSVWSNLYLVTFWGRESVSPGAYGHFGLYARLVVAESIISATLVSPAGRLESEKDS